MVRLKNQPKLRTNLDTDFLKLIAVLSMTVDHVGAVFFPEYPVFRWIGRMAFPLFCYCMTVGLLYTHDIRRILPGWGCLRSFPSRSGFSPSMPMTSWAIC